jgi:WbqC-like protein family
VATERIVTPFTVAIMQPYFIPYAGYYRLFVASDLFVIYDCVQFPRRGWVHRNVLVDASGVERWLTLPLAKAPQSALIRDLRFPPDAAERFAERLRPFPLSARCPESVAPILAALSDIRGTPLDYIERLLELTVAYCGLRWQAIRSSSLNLPAKFRGQDRILEIARRLGAKRYVNAPGGRDLYDPAAFDQAGFELRFLVDYPGPKDSILTRMLREDRNELAEDVKNSSTVTERCLR